MEPVDRKTEYVEPFVKEEPQDIKREDKDHFVKIEPTDLKTKAEEQFFKTEPGYVKAEYEERMFKAEDIKDEEYSCMAESMNTSEVTLPDEDDRKLFVGGLPQVINKTIM